MANRTVLLTGVTGFLGGALAARWTSGSDDLIAVVRAPTVEQARARVAASVARFVGPERAARFAAAITIVAGDLADPKTTDIPIFDTVTHVLHAAACTAFTSTRQVWRSNVEGTMLLAGRMRHAPRLERFLHVSSAYCCGDRPSGVVHETDSPRRDHAYVNDYSRTKAEAERRLLAMAGGIPLLIARPSVIIGHTELGVGPSSSLFWYYRALAALGAGPFPSTSRRDIIPVDYAADALDFLLGRDRLRHDTYHVSAGDGGAVSVEQIVGALGGSHEWRTVPPATLGRMHGELSRLTRTAGEARHLARGLAACARFGALGIEFFDNTRLLSEGFRAPPKFTEYLPLCVTSSASSSAYEQMVDDV